MKTLEDALLLAIEAHRGQQDKYGAPYIFHPLRVMCRLETETERMVALLHDVVEDTALTVQDLAEADYPGEVVAAVDHLSRRPGETYADFTLRIRPHPLARRVKLADLQDNMDVRRMSELDEEALTRLRRYRNAWSMLTTTADPRVGRLIAVNRSDARTEPKSNVGSGELIAGYGLVGDAHAGLNEREVSLIAVSEIERANWEHGIQAGPGAFADNLTVTDMDLSQVAVGDRLHVGPALLEVVQLGKPRSAAHTYNFHGISILPDVGIFCRVLEGGRVATGHTVTLHPTTAQP
jgi:MOSC domain-containing protein YiiM